MLMQCSQIVPAWIFISWIYNDDEDMTMVSHLQRKQYSCDSQKLKIVGWVVKLGSWEALSKQCCGSVKMIRSKLRIIELHTHFVTFENKNIVHVYSIILLYIIHKHIPDTGVLTISLEQLVFFITEPPLFSQKKKWQPLKQTQRAPCIFAATACPLHLTPLHHNLKSICTD